MTKSWAMSPPQLIDLIRRGLNAGIPPTALSNMLECDVEPIKTLSMQVRRERYGTAELSEYLADLTFRAINHQMKTIMYGSPELAQKAAGVVLSKALATSVRQTPEEILRAREDLLAIARQDRVIDIEGEEVEVAEASSFVAMDEQIDDQRQRRQAQEAQPGG
ncbi:MAG: hypothetical protein OK436_04180 [Thaumarchaeota archaeon]|nr:hypothetical protein [Nitrososphaerota archaeon]